MNANLQFIFDVLGSIVSGKDLPDKPSEIDWNLIYFICSKHNITNIFAYAVSGGKYTDIPDSVKKEFLENMYYNIMLDQMQQQEAKAIFDAFEKYELDYMPLKGILLKKLYPSSDMRRMGDIDILIKEADYDKYAAVMTQLGYNFIKESHNEYVFGKKSVLIELHRYLITPGNDDMFSYYETGWNIARKDEKTLYGYELTKEDEFVYIITHFAKHYRNAGCGIKHIIDISLYKDNNDLDMEYVNNQLRSMNLLEFAKNLFKLADVWFKDAQVDNTVLEMTKFIVMSGEYGTEVNSAAAESIRGNYSDKNKFLVKMTFYIKGVFLNKKSMFKKYPLLNKLPFLLPFFWIYRVIEVLIFKRNKISENANKVENRFGENVDRYEEHMKMAGLDIYNGRKNK